MLQSARGVECCAFVCDCCVLLTGQHVQCWLAPQDVALLVGTLCTGCLVGLNEHIGGGAQLNVTKCLVCATAS